MDGMHDLWTLMYLFRNQFQLTAKEIAGLKDFTAFTGILYIKAWFAAPSAIASPAGDLFLFKGLVSYPDSEIGNGTSKKLASHPCEELAGLVHDSGCSQ